MAGLPRIIDAALRLVEQLMQSGQASIRMTGNKKRRARGDIEAVREAMGIAT